MGIRTRLTDALGITVPILSAPMGFVAGGKLAAAVTAAGGLGIIGGGYGDADALSGNLLLRGIRASAAVSSPGRWLSRNC